MRTLPLEKYDKMPRIIIRGSSLREFSISANGSGKIWIEAEDGEGGEMNKIEKVARLLEEFIREDDRDREIAPSLKRMPKTDSSWQGFVSWAKKLLKTMEREK